MKGVFVHDQAICDSVHVGDGTRIWAFTHVLRGAQIGTDCNLGENVFVESHAVIGNGVTIKNGVCVWDKVTLEDGVFVGPSVNFTNVLRPRAFLKRGIEGFLPTRIGRGATLGAGSTILCGTTVGEFAFVGAGALVREEVPAHGLVVGNPGRLIGRVCFCAERLNEKDFCLACGLVLSENCLEQVEAIHGKTPGSGTAGLRVLGSEPTA